MKKGSTVFYSSGDDTYRARVETMHADGTVTITSLFRQKDGKDAPGYIGFKYRVDSAELRTEA